MADELSAAQHIDAHIAELGDWRGEALATVRGIAHEAVPDLVEGWKWRGVSTFEKGGILFTGETYKKIVKLTFAKGAALPDPERLFNSSLEGNVRRAIDIGQGESVNAEALTALILAAVEANAKKKK